MARDLPQLTPAELEVMKVLWRGGRLAARELHAELGEPRGWAYSTTRTVLERLVDKGAVAKGSFHGLNLYQPAITRPQGLARLVRQFASLVLDGSPVPVVSMLADAGDLSDEELAELELLVTRAEEGA